MPIGGEGDFFSRNHEYFSLFETGWNILNVSRSDSRRLVNEKQFFSTILLCFIFNGVTLTSCSFETLLKLFCWNVLDAFDETRKTRNTCIHTSVLWNLTDKHLSQRMPKHYAAKQTQLTPRDTWWFIWHNHAMMPGTCVHDILSRRMVASDEVWRWRPYMATEWTIRRGSMIRAAEYRLAAIDLACIHRHTAYNCSFYSTKSEGPE